MASLASIKLSQHLTRPSSPSAGRLPSDPYYKLRLQAELNNLERAAQRVPSRVELPTPIKYVNTWRASTPRSVASMAAVSAALAAPTRKINSYTTPPINSYATPAPAPVVVEPSSATPVAPLPTVVKEPLCDPVVLSEQVENEEWLRLAAPHAGTEFRLARKRLDEASDVVGYEQAAILAQGLESVRRAMNKLADAVFPPQSSAISEDRLGKEAPTHERAYKARISLALQEAKDSKGRYRLAERELELHHQRLSQLIEQIANGVHGEGDLQEGRQLYVEAWQIVATCRLHLPLQRYSSG